MEGRHAQEKDVSLFKCFFLSFFLDVLVRKSYSSVIPCLIQSLLLLLVTAVDILPAARLFFKTLHQVELVCAGQYP